LQNALEGNAHNLIQGQHIPLVDEFLSTNNHTLLLLACWSIPTAKAMHQELVGRHGNESSTDTTLQNT
jgi:hypothetical protein